MRRRIIAVITIALVAGASLYTLDAFWPGRPGAASVSSTTSSSSPETSTRLTSIGSSTETSSGMSSSGSTISTTSLTSLTSSETSVESSSTSTAASSSSTSRTSSSSTATVTTTSSTVQTSSGSSSQAAYAIGVVKTPPAGANYPAGAEYPTGPVFARFRVFDANWTSPQYTAQQVLAMIAQLHPDVLERMTTQTIDPSVSVPVCPGCQPMDYGQFLNASMDACGCYIIPRLDVNGTWPAGTFIADAKEILETPVSPRFTILSVDNWGSFCLKTADCTCALDEQIFQPLYAMGWKGVGVLNAAPTYYSTCGWATYDDFDANSTETVVPSILTAIKDDHTVQKILLYDPDFPGLAQNFLGQCNPTCDAPISRLETAVSQQSSLGYSYVYPIEQGFWDANQVRTSTSGVFGGKTLYQIFQGWMKEYD